MLSALSISGSILSATKEMNSSHVQGSPTPAILHLFSSDTRQPSSSKHTSAERKFVPPASMTATLRPSGSWASLLRYVGIMGMSLFSPARPRRISSSISAASRFGSTRSGSIPCASRKSCTLS